MENIKRILAVINQVEDIDFILSKAFKMAEIFNANVDVLYVYETPLYDIDELFMLKDNTIDKVQIKKQIKEAIKHYSKADVAVLVKIDDTIDRVWDFVRDDLSVLVVAKYYKSINLSPLKQPLLIAKNSILKYSKAVLVVDSLVNLKSLINNKISKECFLIYNYYYIPDTAIITPEISVGIDNNMILLENEEKQFKELLDKLALNGEFFTNGMLDDIALDEYIKQNNFDLLCYKEDSAITKETKELLNLDIFRL